MKDKLGKDQEAYYAKGKLINPTNFREFVKIKTSK